MKADSDSAEADHTIFHQEILIDDTAFKDTVMFTNNRLLEWLWSFSDVLQFGWNLGTVKTIENGLSIRAAQEDSRVPSNLNPSVILIESHFGSVVH